MTKKIIFCIVFIISALLVNSVEAKTVRVKSYYKPSTGKYINSHYKTSSNKTKLDNYSSYGNYNPYTGKKGTVNPYKW
jgi:hypothetical protein